VTAKWIDTHCHINMLKKSPDEALKAARACGVEKMITIGTTPEDHPVVLEIAGRYAPRVFCTLGVHPHDARLYTEACENFMRRHYPDDRVVAVAEIGLDYHYDYSPRDVQRQVFEKQLALAQEYDLPIQIHTREAEKDTIEILSKYKGRIKGLVHCFTGSQWLANQALDCGLNISISGVVTFKKAQQLRQVVKTLPLDRIHVETDSPFLAPVPHRGHSNEPAFVVHTAKVVAELLGVSQEQLSQQTLKNTQNLFSL